MVFIYLFIILAIMGFIGEVVMSVLGMARSALLGAPVLAIAVLWLAHPRMMQVIIILALGAWTIVKVVKRLR